MGDECIGSVSKSFHTRISREVKVKRKFNSKFNGQAQTH